MRASFPNQGPGATAIVTRNGEIVYRGAAGMANVELSVAMRPDMVFNLFSVTKQFTGVAVLMLADEGKLSLADPITRFLPEYPLRGRTVTVEHLLAHTSGLTNYSEMDEWRRMLTSHVSPDELIALFRDQPFRFEPGERWEYNNSGYVLLGKIIEQTSGMSYGDFIRTRILQPLGMTATYIYDTPGAIIPNRVTGYTRDETGWKNAEYFSLTHGYALGNMLSTVDDLARWNAAPRRGMLLSADSWGRAFTSFRQNAGGEVRYSAGWYIGRLGTLQTLEHGGSLAGGLSQVLHIPSERLFVAVLSNAELAPTFAESLSLEIAARVLGIDPEVPEAPMSVDRLDEYVGVYQFGPEVARTITRRGMRIYSQRSGGQPPLELYPIGQDLFAVRSSGTWVSFERANGRVSSMTLLPRIEPPGPTGPRVN